MAKNSYQPKNNEDLEKLRRRAESAIVADTYGLNPEFFEKNKNIYKRINNTIDDLVKTMGFRDKNISSINNPFNIYSNILLNTIDKSVDSIARGINKPDKASETGVRSIVENDPMSGSELDIINSFKKQISGSFSLMEEYRIAVSLIPQLKRVIRLIVRDIMSSNEITKRTIKDVYRLSNTNIDDDSAIDESNINKFIDEDITARYKIEDKLPIWLYQALISGAKPLLVLPYRDVVKQAISLSMTDKQKYGVVDIDKYSENMSTESLESSISLEDRFKLYNGDLNIYEEKGIKNNKFKYNYVSQEDIKDRRVELTKFAASIIDDKMVEAFYNIGVEELHNTYDEEMDKINEYKRMYGVESAEEALMKTTDAFKDVLDKLENPKSEKEKDEEEYKKKMDEYIKTKNRIKDKIRENLGEFVATIDNNIEVVKEDFSTFSLCKDSLFNKKKKSKVDKTIDGLYLNDKQRKNADEISELFDNEVIIKELDPENVIPISIGSEHVLYYIYEGEVYEEPSESKNRRNVSFANIVASSGYGNDLNMISASNGVSVVPSDPAMSSVFNPANFGNINIPLESGIDVTASTNRVEILKQIVFKTLTYRLKDPSLIDDKTFKDAIINLIRDGYILDRKIKFTAVPASNVVYLAHDIDDKGMPHSILDGTLMYIYMYLAGTIASIMDIVKKSSDKELLEVNMGMQGQIGMTLLEIQKQLSTRNIHVRSFFDNLGSVLRNVATYARYTVPVVNGDKLYDISNIESSSNGDIDTTILENLLSSILSALPCPPALSNMINEAEFSRTILNQSIEYRNSVMERQNIYSKQLTKLYKLLILYTKNYEDKISRITIGEKVSENEIKKHKIDLKNIEVRFSPPTYLTLTNISEMFTSVESVIDSYAKYIFGEDQETVLEKENVMRFKIECLKEFTPTIDIQHMEEIANSIRNNPMDNVANKMKIKTIGKKMETMMTGSSGDDDMGY